MPHADDGPAKSLWTGAGDQTGDNDGDNAYSVRETVSGDRGSADRTSEPRVASPVQATEHQDETPGAVSGGRKRAPGTRRADGGPIRQGRRGGGDFGLQFDRPVPKTGYAWWYVDAVSDDGEHAIVLITFVGSVFSPYYAWT